MKKGPYVDEVLFRKVLAARDTGSTLPLRVWNRACTIVPEFVGANFEIHNGKGLQQALCDRGYGRSQAGRVCTDAHVPGTHGAVGEIDVRETVTDGLGSETLLRTNCRPEGAAGHRHDPRPAPATRPSRYCGLRTAAPPP